jgi:predicted RNA-binding Zn-ribbon protein involved in translation (DUF1610 family)
MEAVRVKNGYKCPHCGEITQDGDIYIEHDLGRLVCPTCGKYSSLPIEKSANTGSNYPPYEPDYSMGEIMHISVPQPQEEKVPAMVYIDSDTGAILLEAGTVVTNELIQRLADTPHFAILPVGD